MSSVATYYLLKERKEWRKNHPIGFYARPKRMSDGSTDLMVWNAGIPGVAGSIWENGIFKLNIEFPEDYPSSPPICKFVPPLFHPNVYPSGVVCLSIINVDQGWRPTLTLKQVLLGIQLLLDNPNPKSPAQQEAYELFLYNKDKYKEKVLLEVKKNTF